LDAVFIMASQIELGEALAPEPGEKTKPFIERAQISFREALRSRRAAR